VSAATSVGARGGSGPGASLSPWPAAAAHPCADVEGLLPAQVNAYTCQHSFKVRGRGCARSCTAAGMMRACVHNSSSRTPRRGLCPTACACMCMRACATRQRVHARLPQAHLLPVANLALHPTKPILATASDDKTWKLWHLPAAELIMCGEGHRCGCGQRQSLSVFVALAGCVPEPALPAVACACRDWVAGVDFHPNGNSLASGSGACRGWLAGGWVAGHDHWHALATVPLDAFKASCEAQVRPHAAPPTGVCTAQTHTKHNTPGDSTVKLWSFEKSKCVATLSDHKQAVWSVKHHHGGDWLASCSLDHSVRCVAAQHRGVAAGCWRGS
jgi:hypothetical protein